MRVDLVDDPAAARVVDVEHRQRRAFLRELLRDLRAEAGAATRYDGDLPLQGTVAQAHANFCVIVCSVLNSCIAANPLPRPCPLLRKPPKGSSIPPPAP